MIDLEFDSIVFQEGNTYVAYSPKLDVSCCGGTVNEALNNLKTAVRYWREIPVFIIKNNLRSANINREEYFTLLTLVSDINALDVYPWTGHSTLMESRNGGNRNGIQHIL